MKNPDSFVKSFNPDNMNMIQKNSSKSNVNGTTCKGPENLAKVQLRSY